VVKTLIEITDKLAQRLKRHQFPAPVSHVYNPLIYARAMHAQYLNRFGSGTREIVLLGMNPGPWGMVQTGVPFGEVGIVKNWLKLDADVKKPKHEHPKVPVRGLDCPRSEVSGTRLWGWAKDTYKTPKRFFKQFFVINYCPLAFLIESGRNFTPDKLPADSRKRLEDVCDSALREMIDLLKPRLVIGVGAFAEKRATIALDGLDLTIARILHPSPASPAANRGWSRQAVAQLQDIGVDLPETEPRP
jgi:single-strand selective monofunctional uracil DNA glycosylase